MKAAVYTKYGPPEIVRIGDIAKPVPGDHDVLIKVHASTVNRTDCGFRSAEYFIVRFFSGMLGPKNKVLGCEFAGVVESGGNAVTLFKAGDKVFGYNDQTFGGHGEYMLMKETGPLTTMPANLSFEESAPLTEGAHYALCDLRAAKVRAGQKILVNGATGGIGSAAVQLAKYFGLEVTAVCHAKNVELVRSLGADVVIDYTREDFRKLPHRFEVIFDAVGKSSFGKCNHLLKNKGIYMSTELGNLSQNPFLALTTPLLGGKRVLFPLPTITKADVNFLKELAETGKFKPVIDRTYPLEQIVEAYKYVESGQKVGNVIMRIRN